MKHSKIAVFIVVIALALTAAVFARSSSLEKQAKVSMEKARAIALAKVPGTIEGAELEREHGRLVYSFDIRTKEPGVTEIQVGAITGRIVSVVHESPAKEAAEKKQEEKEKKH